MEKNNVQQNKEGNSLMKDGKVTISPLKFHNEMNVIKPLKFYENVINPLTFYERKEMDNVENLKEEIIKENNIQKNEIVPTITKEIIQRTVKKKSWGEVCNFQIIPYLHLSYINRKGEVNIEKDSFQCFLNIDGKQTREIKVLTSEISRVAILVQKRYAQAQVDFSVRKVDKIIEALFREATQFAEEKIIYYEAGWQEICGGMRYIYDSCILPKGSEAKTGLKLNSLRMYEERAGEIILKCFELYKDRITMDTMFAFSLMGVLYRAFVESGYTPHFILFLNGKTGSMKTTIGKILFTQLCEERFRDTPRRIDTDTAVSFERAVILSGRDTITLIDDFSPAKTMRKKNLMEENLETIVRMVGDGSTRSRSNQSLEDCRGEGVQGMVVLTGELRGKGVSSNLRTLYCRMERKNINAEAVTWFQKNNGAFSSAIARFAEFVENNWQGIVDFIKKDFEMERKIVGERISERRLTDSAVTLRIAMKIFRKFLIDICKFAEKDINLIIGNAMENIILNAFTSQELSIEESPAITFLRAVADLLRVKEIVLVQKDVENIDLSSCDGFEDDGFYYLNPNFVYKKVVRFLAQTNRFFPFEMKEVLTMLSEENLIVTASNGQKKRTLCTRVNVGNNNKQNFIKIRKEVFKKSIADEFVEWQGV